MNDYQQKIWDELLDAYHNPEKRIWTEKMKRDSISCPMAHSWGGDVVLKSIQIKKNYIDRGWMNEEGDWIN
ncbi:hypothetical protein FACS1894147_06240 [Spirochaetia bacterium]|nr:hypothetical protein FACS1894147_06240 [Spirochaetia bacterium]